MHGATQYPFQKALCEPVDPRVYEATQHDHTLVVGKVDPRVYGANWASGLISPSSSGGSPCVRGSQVST